LHWQKVGSEPAIHYVYIYIYIYIFTYFFWVILAIEQLKWQSTQKKDLALMATMSYWKTLKTVENLAEKTSLKNPWKTKLSKYGKLFF
jgi:hypothetical protein